MNRRTSGRVTAVLGLALWASGCGARLDVGSDLLWTARFESGTFDEWTGVAGGGAWTLPENNTIALVDERAHDGRHAAKLTLTASADAGQATASLVRDGNLPDEAHYSAWYYLPQSVSVGAYWVVMKFRMRTSPADPGSDTERFDLDLKSLPSGQMALRIFDHAQGGDTAMVVPDPLVPVGGWFHLEAFYRNASDATGRLTVWLDGVLVADLAKPTGTPGWVGWDVCSIAANLTPATVSLYVDDCAISRTRVGPDGWLGP